ncbi:MarR family transcriptional regulator [Mycolicibacterium madagascariense]|nr:MarR family transcriptional regulator [Mycolicibacterium madagascariense]MCV7014342.1 MarR family transcriptional regulator [Mycolicibacterium madagascariense]
MNDAFVTEPPADADLLRVASAFQDAVGRAGDRLDATISPSQLRVLDLVGHDGAWSVSGVAEVVGLSPSTISRAVDRLVAAGYVSRERADQDRREVSLGLTRRGRELLDRWDTARLQTLTPIWDTATAEDRAALTRAVHAIAAAASGTRPAASSGGGSGPTQPSGHALRELIRAVTGAPADAVCSLVVETAAAALPEEGVAVDAVTLSLLSVDGRRLVTVAAWPHTTEGNAPVSVDRSAAGESLRGERTILAPDAAGTWAHLPVITPGAVLGVLSVQLPGDPAADGPLLQGLRDYADAVALILPGASAASLQTTMATRTRDWTVAAEMQTRQLSAGRLHAHGVHVAARLEPMHDSCSDSYDMEVVSPTIVDIAVLDCRKSDRDFASVTGFAAAAIRQARRTTTTLTDQAHLADQALWGHFKGRATVDVLLMRITTTPWSVEVLTTSDFTVLRARDGHLDDVHLSPHSPLGHQEDSTFDITRIPVERGDRMFILGDGFRHGTGRTDDNPLRQHLDRITRHSTTNTPDETTRRVLADLLDEWGPTGPLDDTTIVCIDTST